MSPEEQRMSLGSRLRHFGALRLGFLVLLAAALVWAATQWRTSEGLAVLVFAVAWATYAVGWRLCVKGLSRGSGLWAVAHTIFDEGQRRHVVPSLVTASLGVVAALAANIDSQPSLTYGVQTFLSYAITTILAFAVLTVMVLACGSLSSDLEDRLVYSVLTKPLSRWRYLTGKWIGLVAVIVVVLGSGALELYLLARGVKVVFASQPAQVEAVERDVFTARLSARPQILDLEEQVRRRLPIVREQDPETFAHLGPEKVIAILREDELKRVRAIQADETRHYRFTGLEPTEECVLRLRPRMKEPPLSGQIEFELAFDDESPRLVLLEPSQFTHLGVPSSYLDDGILDVHIRNLESEFVVLSGEDGLEVLRPVSGFAANVGRSFAIYAISLGFIAALGVFAGSFLSFPVACFALLIISVAASSSSYLLEVSASAARFAPPVEELSTVDRVFHWIEELGVAVASVLSKFGRVSPTEALVEGRVVTLGSLVEAGLVIGVVWTGVTGALAMLAFRRRELARVQV